MRIFNNILRVTKKAISNGNTIKRFIHKYDFDSNEEILENYLENVMTIGINLPDSKNMLTETSLEKLCNAINKFYLNDEISVAVLHGCGGNFCSGAVLSQKASEKCLELIHILHKGKKPIVGALNGHITNFGFQLAVMCDLRAMEITSIASLVDKKEISTGIPDVVIERLALTVGLSKAKEMVFTNHKCTAKKALEIGFVNEAVACGASFGKAIVWAKSIALFPLNKIIEDKYTFNCLFKSRN